MKTLERRLQAFGGSNIESAVGVATQQFLARAASMIDVAYVEFESPLGTLLLAATRNGLLRIGFESERDVLEGLARRVSPRILEVPRDLESAVRQLTEYFEGQRHVFDMPLDRRLITGFRSAVLAATERIPFGAVRTYAAVASLAGSPNGARAAGRALGGNPIPIVIPCHRVVPTAGGVGGYAGGSERKALLLDIEGALPVR